MAAKLILTLQRRHHFSDLVSASVGSLGGRRFYLKLGSSFKRFRSRQTRPKRPRCPPISLIKRSVIEPFENKPLFARARRSAEQTNSIWFYNERNSRPHQLGPARIKLQNQRDRSRPSTVIERRLPPDNDAALARFQLNKNRSFRAINRAQI